MSSATAIFSSCEDSADQAHVRLYKAATTRPYYYCSYGHHPATKYDFSTEQLPPLQSLVPHILRQGMILLVLVSGLE